MLEQIKYQYSIANDHKVLKLTDQFLKIEGNAKNYEALNFKAQSLKNTFQDERAIETFQYIIECYPEEIGPLLELALCLIDIGEFDKAKSQLETAKSLEPSNIDVINNLIFIEESLQNFSEVIKLSNEAILIDEYEPSIWITISSAHERLGKYEEAIRYGERAIALSENDEILLQMAYNNLGYNYSKMNDLTNAEYYLKKAVEVDGTEPYAINNLGLVIAQKGNIEAGFTLIEKSISLDTENSYAYKNRAKLFLMAGNEKEARKNLIKAKELNYELDHDNEVNELLSNF